MQLEVSKLLTDIYKSIGLIESHIQNAPTLSAYKSNILITDAVERRLSIIGEALWKADKMDKGLNISNKKRIISLRHIIVHDYDLMDDSTIWLICQRQLPILKAEVASLLNLTE